MSMERVINKKTNLKTINNIIYAFNEDGIYIYKVNEPIKGTYIFPDGIEDKPIVGVGKAAFCNCKYLDKLFLPNTINYIHKDAFYNCDSNVEYFKSKYIC